MQNGTTNTTTPITGLAELEAHLDTLAQDPSQVPDAHIFDHVELQLTEANIPPLVPRLLPRLTTVLQRYAAPADPAPLASLTTRLLGPLSFADAMAVAPAASLVQALSSPYAPSASILALSVLHKAAAAGAGPADAAILAAAPDLVSALIARWLAAPQVEVGEKAGRVLGDLLDVDCPLPPPTPAMIDGGSAATELVLRKVPGQGLLWRRIFHDAQVYALIQSLCTGAHPDIAASTSPHQRTLAQGRLLRLLPRLAALDFNAVSAPPPAGSSSPTGTNLLRFGALHMVDRSDALMHLSLVDFFEALVSVLRVAADDRRRPLIAEALRSLLREALRDDEVLAQALATLPDRTVPEEADALRAWIREVVPANAVRVGGWTS